MRLQRVGWGPIPWAWERQREERARQHVEKQFETIERTKQRKERAMNITPKEIEDALNTGKVTAHVKDSAPLATIVLRPKDSSRVFQMTVMIQDVIEL